MPPAGFEAAIPASEKPPTYASDRVATGMSFHIPYPYLLINYIKIWH